MMSNYLKYYCHKGLFAVTTLFISGSIMQTFLAEIGFSGRQVGTYSALTNVVQIMVTVLNIFIADNLSNPKKLLAWLSLSPALLCLPMFLFCFRGRGDVTEVYFMIMLLCCVLNFFLGIKTIVEFRLPYMIIDIRNYARMENINGVISGIISVAVSALVAILMDIYPMRSVMAGGFLLCTVFSVLSAWVDVSMKVRKEYQVVSQKAHKEYQDTPERRPAFRWEKLIKREFGYFYIPNFLRGLTMGVISVIPVICRAEITTNASVLSGLATVLSLSAIVGSAIYLALQYRIRTPKLYLFWSAVQCLFLALMMSGKNVAVFFICYMIVCIGYNITNVAVPVYVTEIIPYEDIGSYTSVRLITMMAGQAIASYGATAVMDYVPGAVVLIIAGVTQLISGIMFYCYKAEKRFGSITVKKV